MSLLPALFLGALHKWVPSLTFHWESWELIAGYPKLVGFGGSLTYLVFLLTLLPQEVNLYYYDKNKRNPISWSVQTRREESEGMVGDYDY